MPATPAQLIETFEQLIKAMPKEVASHEQLGTYLVSVSKLSVFDLLTIKLCGFRTKSAEAHFFFLKQLQRRLTDSGAK
jgi:hypothetical protein